MKPFSPKDPEEGVILGLDFARVLADGETIASATWEVGNTETRELVIGMAVDPPKIAGTFVKQLVIGGALDTLYTHRVKIVTSAGQTFVAANTQRVERRDGFNEA